jgi:general secretion pathway protein D
MIKVVSTSLILIVLLGTSHRIKAQDSNAAAAAASQAAGEEAVRRQARLIQLRATLADAQALQSRGEFAAASKKYEEAWDLVQSIGVNIDREKAETLQGFSDVRMQLAKKAQSRGDLNEADAQVRRILLVDPKNTVAQNFKRENDKLIQDRLGKEPSKQTLDLVPEIQKERTTTSTLVNDARLLMEMGKLDEAEAKLKQAAKTDPENRAAFYYLAEIKEKRYAQEARKREIMAKEKIVEVEAAWNTPLGRDTLPMANIYATTNRIYTSAGRQAIQRKLDAIVLDQWYIPGDIPLSEVIKELDSEAKKRDPDHRGLNFIISSQLDKPGPQQFGPGGLGFQQNIDPLTGQPIQQTSAEAPTVIEDFLVKIDPPLKNVRLADVLDAIVRVAKPAQGQNQNVGIKYSIEDYAIVFSQRSVEAEPLYTRTFKVDPNTFVQGLDGVYLTQNPFVQYASVIGSSGAGGAGGGGGGAIGQGQTAGTTAGGVGPGGYFTFSGSVPGQTTTGGGGGGGQTAGGGGIIGVTLTNSMSSIQDAVRNFFIAAGIDFNTNNLAQGQAAFGATGQPAAPQKAIFFNDRNGILFVRATLRDLDIIEGALQALNVTPPQVTIETKIAEISQRDNKAVGFDWYLGNILANNGKVGFQGGTAPSFADSGGSDNPANPGGAFPGQFGQPSVLPNSSTDQLVTSGLKGNSAIPAIGTLTGILTDPQFRLVIRALEQRQGVDLLSAPKITTLSGRQARISIEDTQTIILGFSVQGLGGGGVGGVGGVGGGVATPGVTQ